MKKKPPHASPEGPADAQNDQGDQIPRYTREYPVSTAEYTREFPVNTGEYTGEFTRDVKMNFPLPEIPVKIKNAVIDAQYRGVDDEMIIKAINKLRPPKLPKGALL